jgi:hypothetical protein
VVVITRRPFDRCIVLREQCRSVSRYYLQQAVKYFRLEKEVSLLRKLLSSSSSIHETKHSITVSRPRIYELAVRSCSPSTVSHHHHNVDASSELKHITRPARRRSVSTYLVTSLIHHPADRADHLGRSFRQGYSVLPDPALYQEYVKADSGN